MGRILEEELTGRINELRRWGGRRKRLDWGSPGCWLEIGNEKNQGGVESVKQAVRHKSEGRCCTKKSNEDTRLNPQKL